VLTIGKLGSSASQLDYYERQVAAGAEDYYAGRGESPGVWIGSGLMALDVPVGSRVSRQAFLGLMEGRHPGDGSQLRRMTRASTVAAIDLTFSAPKSLSVLYAVAGGEMSAALSDAHERAVNAAVGYLEREACFTRRGHGGAERVAGEGFVAAAYRHRLSRAGDPQLHTHVVAANLTRSDGRFTSLDAHALYEHKSAAGAVYRAVLRAEVHEQLPGVQWRRAGRGLFEIDGVPDDVLRHFSQRRAEIEQRAVELVGAEAAGSLTREQMQGIALATRRPKTGERVDGQQWREHARARSSEHGFGPDELWALVERPDHEQARPSLANVVTRLSGADGLTATHNTFARRHALAFVDGISATALEHATDRYLSDASVEQLGRTDTRRATLHNQGAARVRAVDPRRNRPSPRLDDRGPLHSMCRRGPGRGTADAEHRPGHGSPGDRNQRQRHRHHPGPRRHRQDNDDAHTRRCIPAGRLPRVRDGPDRPRRSRATRRGRRPVEHHARPVTPA
jgi:conjugative relaxase-like TrwC/TraI family protein